MASLRDDLAKFITDVVQGHTTFNLTPTTDWVDKLLAILRRHPYDLMQLACVRKPHPHIDSLPAPEKDDHQYGDSISKEDADFHRLASAYFKDDPQGKGW